MSKTFFLIFIAGFFLASCGYKGPINPNTESLKAKIEQF
jgi:predicted small lipoprotein YifL